MRRKRHLRHRPKIINPVQLGFVARGIVTTYEQVYSIRAPRAERLRKGAADPGCSGGWTERVVVADLVQPKIALNVFCELDCVACCVSML